MDKAKIEKEKAQKEYFERRSENFEVACMLAHCITTCVHAKKNGVHFDRNIFDVIPTSLRRRDIKNHDGIMMIRQSNRFLS